MRKAGAAVRAAARDMASPRPRPGQRAPELGQTRRGRDVQLVSRPGLEKLVSRHPFWCRDMAEVRLACLVGREVATRKWTSRPSWKGDRVRSLEGRLDVATSLLVSRHGG